MGAGSRRLDALATRVVAGASCVVALAALSLPPLATPAEAQPRARRTAPRVDGIRLGVAAAGQSVVDVGWDVPSDDQRLGNALSVSWGVHPRVAFVASVTAAPTAFAGTRSNLRHVDALLQYQMQRGFILFPYLETGLTRVWWDDLWSSNTQADVADWLPTLGAGLKRELGAGITVAAGARFTRGNIRRQRADGAWEARPAHAIATTRWTLGAEWHARPGLRPATFGLGARRASVRGLGLTIHATHAEARDPQDIWYGAGHGYGATWGIDDRVSIVARVAQSRPRQDSDEMDLRHRDLAIRFALRGDLHAIRPYAELGATRVQYEYRAFGTTFRHRGTLPIVGGGVLYAVQRDLDVDVGLTFNRRLGDWTEGPLGGYRAVRLRAGLEYRPPR